MRFTTRYISGIAGILLMLFTISAFAADSGWTYITETYTSNTGNFGVYVATGAKCGGNGWWGFSITTATGQAMMSQLLAAFHAHKQVRLFCTGLYNSWDNIAYLYIKN